jgi:mannose-6-phosphate isomerase
MSSVLSTPQVERNQQVERTQRPWGWYETVHESTNSPSGHKVKRIGIHSGQRLSLQKHAHRAEHWLVVRGTGRVTLGEADGSLREFDLQVGQHCDIALGQVHRLCNLGSQPLEIIEIQMGAYLGEDDITRLQDDFGRV